MNVTQGRLGTIVDLIRDQRWSGDELAREANTRAGFLQRFVTSDSNRFVIAHGNSLQFFADLLAVWQAGACAVCVNPQLTAAELANVTSFVEACAVLVDDAAPTSGLSAPVLCTWRETSKGVESGIPASSLDDPALILFTSGTTGTPKGVVHSHRSLASRVALNHAHIGIDVMSRSLCVLPTHFGHGLIGNCLTPLLAGRDVFLFHNAGMQRYAHLAEVLQENDITFMSSVPTFWKLVLRLAEAPSQTPLRRIHIGSAPLSAELWQDVIAWSGTSEVVNAYGITETANWVGGASAEQLEPEAGLVGTPWGGEFAVLADDGHVDSHGEGEVIIRSPSLMSGYYLQPELTDQVLNNGWYRTGDVGILDAQGVLRISGRNRFCINRAGITIYPEGLDLLLERHPDVLEACAFGIPDELSNEIIGIAVHLRDNADVSDRELIDWTRERIRAEAAPERLFRVTEIPKTDRGKINRDTVARHCLGEDS